MEEIAFSEKELLAQIRRVNTLRKKHGVIRRKRIELETKFRDQNASVFQDEATYQTEKSEAEELLRKMAVAGYLQTGAKQLGPGVSVKVMKALSYDPDKAYEWAVEKKLALKLDATAFEKIAANSKIDFVAIQDDPRAQLATDLDAALKQARVLAGHSVGKK